MHTLIRMIGVVVALLALATASLSAQEGRSNTSVTVLTVSDARARVDAIRALVKTLDAQIAAPAPKSLTRSQLAGWKQETAWIQSVRDRYLAHANALEGKFASATAAGSESMVSDMAQMNMQFLALQNAVQNESRKFQTLSNASRTRHDTVKNSITNVR